MRNFFPLEDALRRAYVETESTDSEGKIPHDPELCVPTKVRALQDVVPSMCLSLDARPMQIRFSMF